MINVINSISGGSSVANVKEAESKGATQKPSFRTTLVGYLLQTLDIVTTPGVEGSAIFKDGKLDYNFKLSNEGLKKLKTLVSQFDPSFKPDNVPNDFSKTVKQLVEAVEASGGKLSQGYSTDGGVIFGLQIPLGNVKDLLEHPLVGYLLSSLDEAESRNLRDSFERLYKERKPVGKSYAYSLSPEDVLSEPFSTKGSTVENLGLRKDLSYRQRFLEEEAAKLGISLGEYSEALGKMQDELSQRTKANQVQADLNEIAPGYITDPTEAAERIVHFFTNLAARGKSGSEVMKFLERHGGPNELQEAVVVKIKVNAEARDKEREAREKELRAIVAKIGVGGNTTITSAVIRAIIRAITQYAAEQGLSVTELGNKLGYEGNPLDFYSNIQILWQQTPSE